MISGQNASPLETLQLEIARLREALRPFAEWNNRITHQDIQRAKALLDASRT
jgi:hypothetical protein